MDTEIYEAPAPVAPGYTAREFALYEAIIVRRNKTVAATLRIDKKELDNNETQTWGQYGLMPERMN